jgi:hypothetical protein
MLLNAVKCSSGTICTAVGSATFGTSEKTVAERWNGTAWKVQATPSPTTNNPAFDTLNAISCVTAISCTAAGTEEGSIPVRTLVVHWNGSNWTTQPTPAGPNGTDSRLLGVACTTNCTAVGEADFDGGSAPEFTLAMHN